MAALGGKVALVTGAGRGVGRALALKLAGEGARVVLNDVDPDPAAEVAALVAAAGGEALPCVGNVADEDFPARLVRTALDAYGGLDIVVNNAGFSWDAPIHRATDAQWDLVHGVNLKAAFRILREVGSVFRETASADGREGFRKVVNVTSMSGTHGNAGQAVYSAAKAGLIGLTKTLAKEWGRYRVNVNCVAFGPIATRQTEISDGRSRRRIAGVDVPMGVPAAGLASLVSRIPLGRLGTPEEAAGAIYLFCLPESNYISGQVVEVGGGLSV